MAVCVRSGSVITSSSSPSGSGKADWIKKRVTPWASANALRRWSTASAAPQSPAAWRAKNVSALRSLAANAAAAHGETDVWPREKDDITNLLRLWSSPKWQERQGTVFLPASRDQRETGRHWMIRVRRSTSYTGWVESTSHRSMTSRDSQQGSSVQAIPYSTSETLAG